jgi:hypothetical protein
MYNIPKRKNIPNDLKIGTSNGHIIYQNGRKILQMAKHYTNSFHPKALKKHPKTPSGNHDYFHKKLEVIEWLD